MTKKPFIPHELPIQNLDLSRIMPISEKAVAAISNFNGLLDGMINPGVLLSPITTNEAVLSSKIEGTQATLDEVLQHEAGEIYDEEKTKDINEIINYRKALFLAERALENRELTLNFIKNMHGILLQGVRGKDKNPGEFRTDQNWIGKLGSPIENARFIPPSPLIMEEHLEKWANYIASDDVGILVQLSVAHAQFEIMHPFKDGNGRIGRIFIPLFLYHKKVLKRPMFYLSGYLEQHREMYCDRLLDISENGNWQEWIEFFLNAICIQAEENTQKARDINALYEQMKNRFAEETKSQYAQNVLDTFFASPIINATDFLNRSRISNRGTSGTILKALQSANLIKMIKKGSGQSPARYAFHELINIAEGSDVFKKRVKNET